MPLDDRIRIATPEGVALELTLAGLGSRAMAAAIDALIQGFAGLMISIIVTLSLGPLWEESDTLIGGILSGLFVALFVFYPTLFERYGNGRTPGKQIIGIRVVSTGGQPIGFMTALLRNFFRLIDLFPVGYLVGIAAVITTNLNQRLGDIVAGTIVIRDTAIRPNLRYLAGVDLPADSTWDVTGVSKDEVTAIRRYFERRPSLDVPTQHRVAATLTAMIAPKVLLTDQPNSDEEFLLRVLAEKFQRQARGM